MNETDNRIVNDFRTLVITNVLPRLTDLEEEVRLLRKVAWPVCQSLKEVSQIDDMESKREFLFHLSKEEAKQLLLAKARLSRVYRSPTFSEGTMTEQEYSILVREEDALQTHS